MWLCNQEETRWTFAQTLQNLNQKEENTEKRVLYAYFGIYAW